MKFFGASSLISELSLTILIKELAVSFFLHFHFLKKFMKKNLSYFFFFFVYFNIGNFWESLLWIIH